MKRPRVAALPAEPASTDVMRVAGTAEEALPALLAHSQAMMEGGRTLIERVLPAAPDEYRQWEHYPKGDAIDARSGARWFYHAHPPEQREPGEHGHFHLFLPVSVFGGVAALAEPEKEDPAKVVHVAALGFDTDGLPTEWLAVNQWVTEEFMYPAEAIIARLNAMVLAEAGAEQGMAEVGHWLELALLACRADIEALLPARDAALAETTPRDKSAEILARCPFSIG